MSSRINSGDGEFGHSLPSWMSDHLEGKSYIIDEASQSPSSPLKGSLTDHLSTYSEMDTSNLTKETSVMSQGDLDKLREKYSFPSRIQFRIPGQGETILSTSSGEVAFYEAAFHAGLRFPIHPIIRRILNHYKICPAQLYPNAWQFVICSLFIWQYYKCHMSCDEFRCLYSLSSLPDLGWYYFKARPDKNLLEGSPSNVKGPYTLNKKAREKKAATKDAGLVTTSQPSLKGIVIQEKRPQEDYHAAKKGEVEDPRGKEAMPPLPKRTKSTKGAINAAMHVSTKDLFSFAGRQSWSWGLDDVECPCGAEDTERSDPSRQLAELGEQVVKAGAELKNKSEAVARLEAEVAKLTSKRQLLHQHPNLGIDVASMEMDADFAEEEEAAKEGKANPAT
ncbi:hypothetical protein Acr_02g0010950 [Actinidia rufa]|uniref:Transposase (putative) gypsy type domain-containing protein n=1 Tax=Actinidia rufa TaxID=165716 RepID=A0A7J0E8Z4_9ERIC|nr:hypothetical protein Acr_02g0010950 [Actinidia rufa]